MHSTLIGTASRRQRVRTSVTERKDREDARIAARAPPLNLVTMASICPPPPRNAIPALPITCPTVAVLPHAPALVPAMSAPAGKEKVDGKRDRDEVDLTESAATKRQNSAPVESSNDVFKAMVQSFKDNFTCYLCMDKAVHPVLLVCGTHYVCYGCAHGFADKNKEKKLNKGEISKCVIKLGCTVCYRVEMHPTHASITTDSLLTGVAPPDFNTKSMAKQLGLVDYFPAKDTCPFCDQKEDLAHVIKCGTTHFTCPHDGCKDKFDVTKTALMKEHVKVCKHYYCGGCGAHDLSPAQLAQHKQWESKQRAKVREMVVMVKRLEDYPIQHIVPITEHVRTVLELALVRLSKASQLLYNDASVDFDERKRHAQAAADLSKLESGIEVFKQFLEGIIPLNGNSLAKVTLAERQSVLDELGGGIQISEVMEDVEELTEPVYELEGEE